MSDTEQQTVSRPPYERNVDEHRQFNVECLTCGESARLHCYAGRDWPWKHDMVNPDHVIEYQPVEADTDHEVKR